MRGRAMTLRGIARCIAPLLAGAESGVSAPAS
jgi:hypothetical protein